MSTSRWCSLSTDHFSFQRAQSRAEKLEALTADFINPLFQTLMLRASDAEKKLRAID